MHLAQRAYVLLMLTATLAITGIWSSDPQLADFWRIPAALLLSGLAYEGFVIRRSVLRAEVQTHARAFLGRAQQAAFRFHNDSHRAFTVEFAPVTPEGFEPLPPVPRRVSAPAGKVESDAFILRANRLGPHAWPTIPARLRGPLGLAWWSRDLPPNRTIAVAPDTFGAVRARPRGNASGVRPRRAIGTGFELHQLRTYVRGDPPARIDWKATARSRRLITREYSEDQHLDVVVAIDAGRYSRVRAGHLDRLGVYANVAARFAEIVVPNDDRIGMVVFSDRVLAVCAPDRGLPAVIRIRRSLESLSVGAAESDPLAAAVRIGGLLKRRSLIVLLTDLDDSSVAHQLVRAVRLLAPPHLVVVAGIRSGEIAELARTEARDWRDPWISLAAQEHELRADAQRALLRRLGAPVIACSEEHLERRVLSEYESLRLKRRV